MSRYQIRTPENVAIEDVIDKMAQKGWAAIEEMLDLERFPMSRKNFQRFHHALQETITPQLKAFRLCGLSNICVDATLDAPLAECPKKVGGNPWDLVYHVFVHGNAERFVEDLALQTLMAIVDCMKADSKTAALKALRHAFREVLSDYLFYNPVCGKTELCVYSTSDQITPWERK